MLDLLGRTGVLQPDNSTNDGAEKKLRLLRDGSGSFADLLLMLGLEGRLFVASDADENDVVTGQTSFAATTPTFLLRVPDGTAALPLWVSLAQDGTAAGGDITVVSSFDRVDRFSTGGVEEAVSHLRTDRRKAPQCKLYSGATAAAATDARALHSAVLPAIAGANTQDHAQDYYWSAKDFYPPILIGPAAFLIFTYAAVTGPSWDWSIGWAELPKELLV